MKRTNIIPSFLFVGQKQHESSDPKVLTSPNEPTPCYDPLLWRKDVGGAACSHDTHPPSVCAVVSTVVETCESESVPLFHQGAGRPRLHRHTVFILPLLTEQLRSNKARYVLSKYLLICVTHPSR